MRDEKKTKELLTNINGGIEVKDISKLLCNKVVGVRFTGSRGKMSTTIDVKSLGLSNFEKIDEFVASNMKSTTLNFFDKDVIRKVDNLLNKVRQSMYRYSSTNDGSIYYMTEGNYTKFAEKFEQNHMKEFEAVKSELIENLSLYKKTFQNNLKIFVDSRGLEKAEANILYKSIFNKFPTKENIKAEFNLKYYIVPFPVFNQDNCIGLPQSIIDKMNQDKDASAVDTFYDMVGNMLKETFDLTYSCMSFVEDNPSLGNMSMQFNAPSKTKGFINSSIIKLVEDNKVLKNDKIQKAVAILSRTFRNREDNEGNPITNDKALNITEQLLGYIYNYSCYLGIENKLEKSLSDSVYTEEELTELGSLVQIDLI